MVYLRISFALTTALFLLGVVVGIASGVGDVVGSVTRELRPIVESLAVDPLLTAVLIFLNNVRVALIAFLTGPTLILPLAITFANGYVVGLFLNYSSRPTAVNLALILPHGVLEIPAILLSSSLGTSLALAAIIKYVLKRDVSLSSLLVRYSRYLAVVALLLAVAAFMEVYITPVLYWVLVR